MTGTLSVAARRIKPVVPPPGAEAVPAEDRARALEALAALTAAAAHLGDPDLFHRPRARDRLHLRHVGATDPRLLAGQLASAAENRVAAGLLAVRSVRAELAEQPLERPHFTPDAIAELHRLLVAADPNIPGGGGFRRTTARITWPDGQRFVIAVAPGRPLLGQMERWYRWGARTTSPALDLAALQVLRLFTVHPFPDGNGRIARLLAQCDLVGAGLLSGLLLDLDGWVDANREAHDRAVVAAAEGDLPLWGHCSPAQSQRPPATAPPPSPSTGGSSPPPPPASPTTRRRSRCWTRSAPPPPSRPSPCASCFRRTRARPSPACGAPGSSPRTPACPGHSSTPACWPCSTPRTHRRRTTDGPPADHRAIPDDP
ncbi:Fic/DOC family protein [Streptomyces sp. TLI_053]|uniref:Fic family protein n=1 Tax=Streptomyces sp. TLI_053 TaxID=1855352 RepID=UPI00087BFA18|nr:Fic family protein [Streptomyces sp. TLI_053]SDT80510.1 Fic/DOC family protein [Streptomyces sp. TLI_053]